MKSNLICWLPECCYRTDVDYAAEIILCLADNNIAPLLDSEYAESIWEELDRPPTLRELFYQADAPTYKDEPFSVIDGEDSEEWVKQTVAKYPDITMGESSTEHIADLVRCGVKNITFTSYGWHLFRLFNKWNIRMPFTTQLRTWIALEKKYGSGNTTSWGGLFTEVEQSSKFSFCWIMLDQTRHWKKLITWATQHNKTIGIAVPDSKKSDTEWIYKQLQSFIKTYKEVTK